MKFAKVAFAFQRSRSLFEEALDDSGLEEKYERIGWDYYDESLEIYGVENDVRLTETQQRIIFDNGFARVFVNHKDGWETHYGWGTPFKAGRGWRRRYVSDPTSKTTNVIAGPPNPGYYEVSEFPESFPKEWLDSCYMRLVPDPLRQPESETDEQG